MLTVERNEAQEEVVICFDAAGAILLKQAIERLIARGEADHDHLMTPAWAGTELDEVPNGEGNELVHHLRLVFRPAV